MGTPKSTFHRWLGLCVSIIDPVQIPISPSGKTLSIRYGRFSVRRKPPCYRAPRLERLVAAANPEVRLDQRLRRGMECLVSRVGYPCWRSLLRRQPESPAYRGRDWEIGPRLRKKVSAQSGVDCERRGRPAPVHRHGGKLPKRLAAGAASVFSKIHSLRNSQ